MFPFLSSALKVTRYAFYSLLKSIFPRFTVWRALQMARFYSDTVFSRRRLQMLEEDAKDALNHGELLDSLRILCCILVINPDSETIRKRARELVASCWDLKISDKLDANDINLLIDQKLQLFISYTMQSVDRGSFSKACTPIQD